ncbi:MAG TPA: hypothetical protein VH415_10560 [Nitrososphaeraceae archaeon]|jgi:hypothetical protein
MPEILERNDFEVAQAYVILSGIEEQQWVKNVTLRMRIHLYLPANKPLSRDF